MRPIDADALKKAIPETTVDASTKYRYCVTFEREDVLAIIDAAPTVDIDRPTRSQFKRMAVQLGYEEVVYCKDCEFAEPYERADGEIGYYCHDKKHSFVYGAPWEREFNPAKEKNDFCSDGERRADEKV